jgi:D-3-phosphoglycerate dehydrogenase
MILNLEPRRYSPEIRRPLEALGPVTYRECRGREELRAALREAPYRVVLTRIGLHFDRRAFDAAPHLRWLGTPTTGLDHIDLEEAERRGVEVLSLRGELELLRTIPSTAEHTWTLLLALRRRLPAAHRDVLAGHWRREPFLGRELDGCTLGIVGHGRLGKMVAGYGRAFGMRVLAFDRDPSADTGVEQVSLELLLGESDVLSLHLPLNAETHGFLSAHRLARMRPGAVLINTARGELIDEAALLEALQSGRLAGAALDVLAGDSAWDGRAPEDHPLIAYAREHDNLLLTPHIGGYGQAALNRTRRFLVEKLATAIAKFTGVDP